MSAVTVRKTCERALLDQKSLLSSLGCSPTLADQSLAALASLGAEGRQEKNCRRELVTLLGTPKTPEPHALKIEMRVTKPRADDPPEQQVDFEMMLPHVYLAHLYHYFQ